MARKPNYAYERNMRAKAKADKREAKREARRVVRGDAPDGATALPEEGVAGEAADSETADGGPQSGPDGDDRTTPGGA